MTSPIDRAPAWSLAVVAMVSVQLGAALAVVLFAIIFVAATSCLRITLGAVRFVLMARPPPGLVVSLTLTAPPPLPA